MVLFFLTAVAFIAAPDWIIRYIESIGRNLVGWKSQPVTLGDEKFWLVLVASLMITLSYVAYKAQINSLRNISYTTIIIISKLVSTIGFIVCFLMFDYKFLYLAGAVVDGFIFLITATLYHSAIKTGRRV